MVKKRRPLPAIAVMSVVVLLMSCTQAPDLSGVVGERGKAVQRYDTGQALASNGKVLVAGTQSGAVLVSRDQGKSWVRTVLGPVSLVDVTVCGAEGFIGIDHYHKVWSADAEGNNWKSVPLEAPRTPLAVTCDGAGNWWVAGIRAVIAGSRDRGASWQVTDLGEDTQITTLQFLDDKHGVALGEFGLAVYTADGGATWQKQGNATQAALYRLFLHDGTPYGVGAGGVIARFEGGSWRPMPYPDPVPVFLGGGTTLPGQSALAIGGPGGLLRTVSTVAKQ